MATNPATRKVTPATHVTCQKPAAQTRRGWQSTSDESPYAFKQEAIVERATRYSA
jgi:hypothetical protein